MENMSSVSELLENEAKRCLQCKNPRCMQGCPVQTNVPKMIRLFLNKDIVHAGEMLFQNNPLSAVCSLVCPRERQCEGACVLGIRGRPLAIGKIEHDISGRFLKRISATAQKKGQTVAIIGSGPAGITIAITLALRGYDVTIFEAHDKIGGVMMYGIPAFRLPKSILEKLKAKMLEMGIRFRPNTVIGQILTIDDLFRDGYRAVFIGTGVWRPRNLGIKGESLGHVHYAIDYLKNPDAYELGDTVCVIGAGNVAMDAARTAKRNGASSVTVLYRGRKDEMSADKHEVEMAHLDGVQFLFHTTPVEFTSKGVLCHIPDETGTVPNSTSRMFFADSAIIAISQGPKDTIVSSTKGIAVGTNGLINTDVTGRTTRAGVFASGDVVTGAKTVVEAVRVSKAVADAMDTYMKRTFGEGHFSDRPSA